MIEEIKQKYKNEYGEVPLLIKAPGRINLIGEHTDYNNGFVMPASIDKAMYFAIGKTAGQKSIQVQAANYNEVITLGNGRSDKDPSWSNYLKAIVQILKERGLELEGINCIFGGDIPIGAGLSSSAALCCGFIFGISTLLKIKISKEEIAIIAQEAEHRIGLNCGLMDQYAVLFGKKDHVFRLDCKNLEYQYFPMQLKSHSLILIDSKIEHQLEGTPYNDRRESCERVVKIIASKYPEIKSLRDVTIEKLNEFENEINALDFIRAKYVLDENNRVRQMMVALKEEKLSEAGVILFRGHQALSEEYNVSLPEMDLLVSLAKKEKSILGARMMGGGFGGCTINLIENKDKELVLKRIQAEYLRATGNQSEYYIVQIENGLELVE